MRMALFPLDKAGHRDTRACSAGSRLVRRPLPLLEATFVAADFVKHIPKMPPDLPE